MDNLSHGLIGLAAAHIFGCAGSWNDPATISIIIGSQAPDFDILMALRGKLAYIKAHRSFSHSIAGSFLWALLIGISISWIYQDWQGTYFLWALLGIWTHIGVDFLNTHGASLTSPSHKERKSYALLHVFDPVLILLLSLSYLLPVSIFQQGILELGTLFSYLAFRFQQKNNLKQVLTNITLAQPLKRLEIMPSLSGYGTWDFVLETDQAYYLGHYLPQTKRLQWIQSLSKSAANVWMQEISQTPLGSFFNSFTPFLHLTVETHEQGLTIYLYDLRYFWRYQFAHKATFCFNQQKTLYKSYLTSYGKQIQLPCV